MYNGPFDYQLIRQDGAENYRVRDVETDSRIATCYNERNAIFIVSMLNLANKIKQGMEIK